MSQNIEYLYEKKRGKREEKDERELVDLIKKPKEVKSILKGKKVEKKEFVD